MTTGAVEKRVTVNGIDLSVIHVPHGKHGGRLYLQSLPPAIPADHVLVHNDVRPPLQLGSRGFRVWLSREPARYAPCACSWAPDLGPHFHAKR